MAAWSCLLAAGPLLGCRRPAALRPPSIILIVVDTLRADRLGVYGSTRQLTPFLDALAARGTVFQHAYAQSSWTNPSVASIFTSRFQSQHGVVSFASSIEPSGATLAEVLHDRGYATAAFVANGLLAGPAGYGRGFEVYRTYWGGTGPAGEVHKERADALGADALAWLDGLATRSRPPFFLYLQYVEPHTPYSPPEAMLDRVLRGRPRPDVATATNVMMFGNVAPPDAAAVHDVEDVYDAEVLSLDASLRETFAALAAHRWLEDAVVVVTADHGEEFEDHGRLGHGDTLYDELIHVPLIVQVPGSSAHGEVPDTVSLVDVAPTLLELAGVAPPGSFEGRSFRTRLAGARLGWQEWLGALRASRDQRPAVSELLVPAEERQDARHERAIVLGGRKLIVAVNGQREVYDLTRDPHEKSPLAAADEAPGLQAALRTLEARLAASHPAPPPEPTPELRERMKALGYTN